MPPDTSPSNSYTPINRPEQPSVHCEVLTGSLVMSGRCWGEVGLVEHRLLGRNAPRCQGHAGVVYRAEPVQQLDVELRRRLVMAERGLAAIGWAILELDVDATAGTGWAVFRSREGRVLRVVADKLGRTILEREREYTVQRHARELPMSGHPKHRGGPVTEVRREFLGRSRAADFPTAMREAVTYMTDNRPSALGQGEPTERQRQLARGAALMLARATAAISPPASRQPKPLEVRSIADEPLSPDWLAECEHVCCRGDGWDPYVPSLDAADSRGRRWVAASGAIVDGRGVHREGTFRLGPELEPG